MQLQIFVYFVYNVFRNICFNIIEKKPLFIFLIKNIFLDLFNTNRFIFVIFQKYNFFFEIYSFQNYYMFDFF